MFHRRKNVKMRIKMQMRCGLEFALHLHQCKLPKFLASHANSHSHGITSPGSSHCKRVSGFPISTFSCASGARFCAPLEKKSIDGFSTKSKRLYTFKKNFRAVTAVRTRNVDKPTNLCKQLKTTSIEIEEKSSPCDSKNDTNSKKIFS